MSEKSSLLPLLSQLGYSAETPMDLFRLMLDFCQEGLIDWSDLSDLDERIRRREPRS